MHWWKGSRKSSPILSRHRHIGRDPHRLRQLFRFWRTKESLLAIQAGKAKFTDHKIFQVALDCKLPVIAAMQGHGIGAGWTLGMFADVVLLSEESRYVSPYMNYGFTPGAGRPGFLRIRSGMIWHEKAC